MREVLLVLPEAEGLTMRKLTIVTVGFSLHPVEAKVEIQHMRDCRELHLEGHYNCEYHFF